jgi:hypothetical protein
MRFMSPASLRAWHDEHTRLINRPIRSRSGTVAGRSPHSSHFFLAIFSLRLLFRRSYDIGIPISAPISTLDGLGQSLQGGLFRLFGLSLAPAGEGLLEGGFGEGHADVLISYVSSGTTARLATPSAPTAERTKRFAAGTKQTTGIITLIDPKMMLSTKVI